MKDIFKKPQKGVSPQKIKKEYNTVFKLTGACALMFLLLSVAKIISLKSFLIAGILIIAFSGFYDAYLGIRYRMFGRFGSFPMRTGKPALITGVIMGIFSLIILIIGILLYDKL